MPEISFLRKIHCDAPGQVCCPLNNDPSYQWVIKRVLNFTSTTIARNFNRNPTIAIDATKVKVRSSMHWPALESRFGDDSDGNDEECGIATDQRIIGGEIAALDDFPWTALLIYNSSELRVNYQLPIDYIFMDN